MARKSATTTASRIEDMHPKNKKPPFDPEASIHLQESCRRDVASGCLIFLKWQRKKGYGATYYRGTQWLAHRLSYYALHGPIAKGCYVCHRCDNRLCVAVEHLYLGTRQENATGMVRKDRASSKLRLRREQVVEIKRRLVSGHSCAEVAKAMSIAYPTIFSIKSGRTWSRVRWAVPEDVPRAGQPGLDHIAVNRVAPW